MTAMVALGKLETVPSFPADDVTPELLNTVQEYDMIHSEGMLERYESLIPALAERGRDDLVSVIRQFRLYWEQKVSESGFATEDLVDLIPPGASFVMADLRKFGRPVPAERKGSYWGPPRDGATAIRELENLRESGTTFVVFTHRVFWWFDRYAGLQDFLAAKFPCLRRNERFIVYDLRPNDSE